MTKEEALKTLIDNAENGYVDIEEVKLAFSELEQEPCEMTAEEYRQRMIQAFHNADCDRLITLCALPTEKEFEHLEWLLKTHYKKEPCEDAISRQAVLDALTKTSGIRGDALKALYDLPSVTPQPKTRHWIKHDTGHSISYECSRCGCAAPCMETADSFIWKMSKFCPDCGAKMESEGEEWKVEWKVELH